MTPATLLHLQSAERQLAKLSEMVADMKAGPSSARLGNLAHDGSMAAMDLAGTFSMLVELAELAMCAEQDATVIPFRRAIG